MKKFAAYILVLLPSLAFGQLLPKVPDFQGNIEKVTEKRYGIEVNANKGDSGVFKPEKYSGWKYTYLFNENSELIKRTNTFQKEVRATFEYQRNTIGNVRIDREIIKNNEQGKALEYIEYENFFDSEGRIQKVNFWSFNAQKNTRELFLVEKDAEYKNNQLTSFARFNIKENGDSDSGEKCDLFYNSSGQLIRIERKDIALNLKTIIYYYFNSKGLVDRYSIDYLVGLRNDQNKQKQDILFVYDRRGNWIKRLYTISGKKTGLEAKRKIRYR